MSSGYTEKSFWEKLADHAADAGKEVVLSALKLYYAAIEKNTPIWAQGVAFAALAYFISPIDAIPDFTPGIGYMDDAGVLATAITSIATYITAQVSKQAANKLKDWFG